MSEQGQKIGVNVGPQSRRPYEAPRVAAVDLATDEVLNSGCKLGAQNAIGPSNCAFGSCTRPGS